MSGRFHDPTGEIIDRIRRGGSKVRQVGRAAFKCQCPAHDDRNPSLSVREDRDGNAQVKCFTGCDARAVLAAIGLEPRDLFRCEPGQSRRDRNLTSRRRRRP